MATLWVASRDLSIRLAMPLYVELKSPFVSSASSSSLAQGLDRKAEYLDADGVPRRSDRVTRRMILRGVSIGKALAFSLDEQAHTSLESRAQDVHQGRRATMQFVQEAAQKREANAALKFQAKLQKQQWLKDADSRSARRLTQLHEMQHQVELEFRDLVDVTEKNTAQSPSRTNTFIDNEGNLRRRVTAPPESGHEAMDILVSGSMTPPPSAPMKQEEPQRYV
ncbi:hypothetical protein BBJ28_00017132 [Nothophytophthora sp. Chile5]|nr:hypothetical protein BBJ28_00017132 [Nothophytophthora sp. Chile5]